MKRYSNIKSEVDKSKIGEIKKIRTKNIIGMATQFSSTLRTYTKGTKDKIIIKIFNSLKKLKKVKHQDSFDKIHDKICRELKNEKIKHSGKEKNEALYGQIAKTINVILKVLVYYNCFPELKRIEKYLHAAIDRKMLVFLRNQNKNKDLKYNNEIKERIEYQKLQECVREYINNINQNKAIRNPVQFDDIYWKKLKSK